MEEYGGMFYVSKSDMDSSVVDPRLALIQRAIDDATTALPVGTRYELMVKELPRPVPVEDDEGNIISTIAPGWNIIWYSHDMINHKDALFCERDPNQWKFNYPRGCYLIGVMEADQ